MNAHATVPSRDFMVQQAALTALTGWYPNSIALMGRRREAERVLRLMRDDYTEGHLFAQRVRAEFNRIASQFQRAA